MKPVKVSGVGCCLLDRIYDHVDFCSPTFRQYMSRQPGDGGLEPGKLAFEEEVERFAGQHFADILPQLTQGRQPDKENIGGPCIVALIGAAQLAYKESVISFYGCHGDDHVGTRLCEALGRTPIDLTHYRCEAGSETASTNVLSDPHYDNGHGERTFVNTIGASWRYLPSEVDDSFYKSDICVFGGTAMDLIVWLMIFLTSLATLALIIDSCVCIRAVKIMPADLIETVKNSLAEGDLGAAMEACEATPGPLSNILMSGFNSITEGYDVVLDSVSSQASIETEKLMQRVNYLNLCGQLAPMFGLMGTVTGMVSAFGSLGTVKGAAQTAALAQSISSALYTTAVGLFIAVPAILGFTFIKNNASKIILMMEAMTYELINTLKNSEVKEQ